MEIANCRCKYNLFGSDVQLLNITPAEALLLRKMHFENVNGDPIHQLKVTGSEERSNTAEKVRLAEKYTMLGSDGKPFIEEIFPGAAPQFPTKFEETNLTIGDIPEEQKKKEAEAESKATTPPAKM